MTPLQLTEEYLFAHDLREASQKTYRAATRALMRHFGPAITVQEINHRRVLEWRREALGRGLSKRSWNTYSNHLRTIWGYAIECELLPHAQVNPFKKTSVIPPKRPSKTVAIDAIQSARSWLKILESSERCTGERARITPTWFWRCVFETFYETGIRLNALLCIRKRDVDWDGKMILVRGETEKTHREFSVPITDGMAPHIHRLLQEAETAGISDNGQLFNVNRFSHHYTRQEMNADQVEAMYRKLTEKTGVRMTPHRFRHTLATDLMKQHERNIHVARDLLNHSNIQTTMGYIEADHDQMRAVLNERSLAQGALQRRHKIDYSGSPQATAPTLPSRLQPSPAQPNSPDPTQPATQVPLPPPPVVEMPGIWAVDSTAPPPNRFEQNVLMALIAQHMARSASWVMGLEQGQGQGQAHRWGTAVRSGTA
ncbi:tyrosine recombinase XerC [Pseudomonas aeruginosa]|uniref:site-specific integrase n=1 Tax=Pseudomonas aeruginosa TaxID=287 RepID=UPI0029C07626|nr:tyrosine-type recombinase/integrase [Pseudomonas aeruginosa]